LIISDVPGDDLSIIGSAPTSPDTSTFAEALAILDSYGTLPNISQRVVQYLQDGVAGLIQENPKPDDPIFAKVTNTILGSNRVANSTAEEDAEMLGYRVYMSNRLITGDTKIEPRQFVGQ